MQNPKLAEVLEQHSGWLDSLLANFEKELNGIIHAAQMRMQGRLRDELALDNGAIKLSIQNSSKLRRLDAMFLEEMDRAGYQHLVNELVAQFPGQLPYFNQVLESIGAPPVKFGPRDLRLFVDQGISAGDSLNASLEMAANTAKNRVMFAYNGLPFTKLVDMLAQGSERAVPAIVRTAETAATVYFRVISDRGYQAIEAQRAKALGAMRYRYEGPLDKLTRPFCTHLLVKNESYTRPQIGRMDNGQLPNTFITCGGYLCRHQWIVDLN